MCASGGFPVAISNTVQPMLHISDFLPYPVSLITLKGEELACISLRKAHLIEDDGKGFIFTSGAIQ